MTGRKTCSKCKKSKAITEFSPYKKGGEIRRGACADCRKTEARKYRESRSGQERGVLEMVLTGEMRKCRGCGRNRDLAHFHKNAQGRDGRHSRCRDCRLVENGEYLEKRRA